jgi:Fe-S-cluster containining protein
METNVNKIRKLSKKKDDENWEFRTFLKGCDSKRVDLIVHRLYREISSEIDCRTCANCCRKIQPVLDQNDVEKLSKGLGLSVAQFKDRYLVEDDEHGKYRFNKMPCPFLKGNICSCHAYRPKDCVSYPHLHKKDFVFRLISVVGNCSVCPIVFNVYERLKDEIWDID